MYGFIKEYMSKKGKEFLNPMNSDMFISLCIYINNIVEGNVSDDGCIDRRGIIEDTYNTIYNLIFKPMVEQNMNLMKEFEKQIKYGTRLTICSEELKNINL